MNRQLLTTTFAALLALAFVLGITAPAAIADEVTRPESDVLYVPDTTAPSPDTSVEDVTFSDTETENVTAAPDNGADTPTKGSEEEITNILDRFEAAAQLPLPEFPDGTAMLCLYINGRAMPEGFAAQVDGTVYLSVESFAACFGAQGLNAENNACYITYADRCIPCSFSDISVTVRDFGGVICAPIEALTAAAGLSVTDSRNGELCIWGAPTFPTASDIYSEEDLYWMSRIISSEAGIEPFLGKLAVGTVVINRTRSDYYPDTVHGVVFDKLGGVQFSPVQSGTIYNDPGESSILAAKLCLEGYCLDESILFFFNSSIAAGTWITTNRTYAMTVGRHDFYS